MTSILINKALIMFVELTDFLKGSEIAIFAKSGVVDHVYSINST